MYQQKMYDEISLLPNSLSPLYTQIYTKIQKVQKLSWNYIDLCRPTFVRRPYHHHYCEISISMV